MPASNQTDVSPEAMQSRIQQARREAETLKDRIKRKKDELADTTRTSILPPVVRASRGAFLLLARQHADAPTNLLAIHTFNPQAASLDS